MQQAAFRVIIWWQNIRLFMGDLDPQTSDLGSDTLQLPPGCCLYYLLHILLNKCQHMSRKELHRKRPTCAAIYKQRYYPASAMNDQEHVTTVCRKDKLRRFVA